MVPQGKVRRTGLPAHLDAAQASQGCRIVAQDQVVERGRAVGVGDAEPFDQRPQPLRIAMRVIRRQDQAAAGREGPVDAHRAGVEGEGDRHQEGLGPGSPDRVLSQRGMNDLPVGDGHALGRPGRAGGVDEVSEVVRPDPRGGRFRRQRPGLGWLVGEQHPARSNRHLRHQPARSDHHLDAGVVDDVGAPRLRIGGVDGHVGGARFQHRQQGHHGLDRTVGHDAHALVGADSLVDQLRRQAVGRAFEKAVVDGVGSGDDGRRVRGAARLLRDQLVQAQVLGRVQRTEARRLRGVVGDEVLLPLEVGRVSIFAQEWMGRLGIPGEQPRADDTPGGIALGRAPFDAFEDVPRLEHDHHPGAQPAAAPVPVAGGRGEDEHGGSAEAEFPPGVRRRIRKPCRPGHPVAGPELVEYGPEALPVPLVSTRRGLRLQEGGHDHAPPGVGSGRIEEGAEVVDQPLAVLAPLHPGAEDLSRADGVAAEMTGVAAVAHVGPEPGHGFPQPRRPARALGVGPQLEEAFRAVDQGQRVPIQDGLHGATPVAIASAVSLVALGRDHGLVVNALARLHH